MSVAIAGATEDRSILGACVHGTGARFGLFADPAGACAVRLFADDGAVVREEMMKPLGDGLFEAYVPDVAVGALYKFIVDGRELADPYARYLPRGVDGPAQVTQSLFEWQHGPGVSRPLAEHAIYELHVGTFSAAGTYEGVREHLSQLVDLGITAIELLPVAAFPGQRGWGYEGTALYAPFAPYGTPDDLKRLVDEAHGLGLSVFLDVVYNHFGPSGNHLPSYSRDYFSKDVRNAWGDAPNYAHPIVRRMVVENALYWLNEFRFDGLRLDATHAIIDKSFTHILRELTEAVARLEPERILIAEDNRNDPSVVTETGVDAIWADDFHHQLRVTMTGERDGYYGAYEAGLADLARTIARGWLFEGQTYPVSGQSRGKPADDLEAPSFVYCIQNHDQIGNRALGDRLSAAVSPAQYRVASTLLLFLPMTPLLFMGQEWAASSPFLFFTDHEPELGRRVAEGRRSEFASFGAFADPETRARIPDPQDVSTFEASRLNWQEREQGEHARTLELYKKLLWLRGSDPVLSSASRRELSASNVGEVLLVRSGGAQGRRVLVANFGDRPIPLAELVLGHEPRILLRSDLGVLDATELPKHTAAILAD
ncbi:MAG: malto-oligosyltrehalose trehalohydrolase [Myxococcales bacterium]|nr:malto-oligosyltrehalose trehalohydrolase [Myxococcales bacterium]